MNMLWHNDERMQFVMSLAAISVKRLQEEAYIRFHDKQSAALPR